MTFHRGSSTSFILDPELIVNHGQIVHPNRRARPSQILSGFQDSSTKETLQFGGQQISAIAGKMCAFLDPNKFAPRGGPCSESCLLYSYVDVSTNARRRAHARHIQYQYISMLCLFWYYNILFDIVVDWFAHLINV